MSDERADRYNEGKLRMSVSPWLGFLEVIRVAEAGVDKYAALNFRKGLDNSNLLDAAERHMMKFRAGEDVDPDTGCLHPAAAAWNLLVVCEQMVRGMTHLDDRFDFGQKLKDKVGGLLTTERWDGDAKVERGGND